MWTTDEGIDRKAKTLKAAAKFDPEDSGVWFDSTEGVEMGGKIQEFARQQGWGGPVMADPEDESYFESVEQAQDYLNELTPEGYHFGYDDEGNWGLFEGEYVAEPHLPPPTAVPPQELGMKELDEDLTPEEREELEKERAHAKETEDLEPQVAHHRDIRIKAQTFAEDDAGPWFESAHGVMIGGEIQKLAEQHGWTGPTVLDTEDEQYFSQSKEAEDFMQQLAPGGYYFGMSDEGDWGLWKLTPEGESEVAAPKFASLYKKAQGPGDPPYQAPVGMRWVKRENQWTLMPDSEAQSMTAKLLDHVTIGSEFRDDMWPIRAAFLDVGDRVYVRSLKTFGEVIRIKGDSYRVQVSVPDRPGTKKTVTNTYWGSELEPR